MSDAKLAEHINAIVKVRGLKDKELTEAAVYWHRTQKMEPIIEEVKNENKNRIKEATVDVLGLLQDVMAMSQNPEMRATIKWSDILNAAAQHEKLFGGVSGTVGAIDLDLRFGKAKPTPRQIILEQRQKSLSELNLTEEEIQGILSDDDEDDPIFYDDDEPGEDEDIWN